MPDYVETSSLKLRKSVSQNKLPAGTWVEITRAEHDAAQSIAERYRKWTGSAVAEMTQGEKDVVDAAELTAARTDQAAVADAAGLGDGATIRALIENFNKRDNYLTNRILELQEDLQAIKASTGGTANIRSAIRASYLSTATRPKSAAVTDYKDEITSGNAES